MVYGNRIHVKCSAAVGNVRYFAASAQNSQHVARMLTVITTAQVAGRTLTIRYDPNDLSGASFGCLSSDCRIMRAVGFGQ
jgi:hypothetical protein